MLMVCMSHFADLVFDDYPRAGYLLVLFGLPATPVFLVLSGVVLGHLTVSRKMSLERHRRWLIDRGLFLLLIGHLLLSVPHLLHGREQFDDMLLHTTQITDVIGVCLLVCALIVGKIEPERLVRVSVAALLGAVLVGIALHDRPSPWPVLTRLLFGAISPGESRGYVLPIAIYLPVFLIGLAYGQMRSALLGDRAGTLQLASQAAVAGVAGIVLAVAVKAAALGAKPWLPDGWELPVYYLTDPRQKLPVGPTYLMFCGGVGLLMAASFLWAGASGRFSGLLEAAATVGRASLAVFILQAWVYLGMLPAFGLRYGAINPWLWLPLSLLGIWWFARFWDRAGWNRWLTLGLRGTQSR